MEKDDKPTPMDTEPAEESESSMETVEEENKGAGEAKQVLGEQSPKRPSESKKVAFAKPIKKGPSAASKDTVETIDPARQAKQALEGHPSKRPTEGRKMVATKTSKKDESHDPVDKENVSDGVKPAPEILPPPQVRGKKSILSPRNKQSPRTSTETSAACDEPKDDIASSAETQQAAEVWPPKVRVGGKKTSETVLSPSKVKKDEPHDVSPTSKEFMEIARTDHIVATVQVQPGVNVPTTSGSGSQERGENPDDPVDPATADRPGPSGNAPTDEASKRKNGSGPAPDPEDDDDDDDEEVVEDRDKSTYL